jgi:hypothetical protein
LLIEQLPNPTEMITFNASFVENWRDRGYRYILILPRDKYGVLRPLNEDRPVAKGYTIELDELRFIHMDDDYFLVKEKDGSGFFEPQYKGRTPRV